MIKRLVLVLTLVAIVGLVSALALAGCGASGGGSSSTTDEQATEGFDGGTITVGALGTMTGVGAMGGAEQIWAQKQAMEDINAAGGITMNGKKYKLDIKFVDDKSDPTEGAAAMEKLIKVDGLKLILSTQVTPINQAAVVVAEKYKAFYQMVVAWTDWMRDGNYEWTADMFFTPASVAEVPFKMVQTMPKSEQPKVWGMFTEDNADGQGLAGGVKATAKAYGYNLVTVQAATPGSKDYSSSILKLKQAGVDGLVAFCAPADAITFTKQMKEQNFSPKFMMGWKGFWPSEYAQGLGADSNYVGHDGFWNEDLPFPGAKELGQKYSESHNGNTSVSIGLPYAAVQILAKAIENANSTEPAAVRDAIWGQTFTGTTMGDVTYDAQGIYDITPVGSQWMDQKRVVIVPDSGNTMEWFAPWDQR